jgi:predicted metal-dependent hydrolase
VPLIDYVITHELCHLRYPNHGPEFARLLGKLMPDYARRKAKLEIVFT